MPNGDSIFACNSSVQMSLIVPKPGSNNIFYVFTTDCFENNYKYGLRYSIVDMTKNNHFGDVIQKNILLANPVSEKLTAIRHENGVDIWVIAHEWNTNGFISFLVTNQGVNTSPILSNVGLVFQNQNPSNAIGYLKPSPNGKILADATQGLNYYQIFKFKYIFSISIPILFFFLVILFLLLHYSYIISYAYLIYPLIHVKI